VTGNWKCLNAVETVSWDDAQRNLEITDKEGFLEFVRKMMRWTPESTASASELLEYHWLLGEAREGNYSRH